MSSFEKFKEKLPSKEKFYSLLTFVIIDKEYDYVLNVWDKFEIKAMKDCYDLYLKCDVLLLADSFEKFRSSSLINYESYPSHYLGTSALILDAMLNMTKVGKTQQSVFKIL